MRATMPHGWHDCSLITQYDTFPSGQDAEKWCHNCKLSDDFSYYHCLSSTGIKVSSIWKKSQHTICSYQHLTKQTGTRVYNSALWQYSYKTKSDQTFLTPTIHDWNNVYNMGTNYIVPAWQTREAFTLHFGISGACLLFLSPPHYWNALSLGKKECSGDILTT